MMPMETDKSLPKSGNDLEIRYTYDALDRLIKEEIKGNKT